MNKSVLITGASRGIGRAMAQAFAAAGYDLVLTCMHQIEALDKLGQELEQTYGISCCQSIVDAGDYEAVTALFAQIKHLDVLVNNAGIAHMGLLQNMSPEQWHRIIATHLDGCFYTCKHAIPLMLAQGEGHILNISSVWGNVGASMEVAYSAAKGGVNSFTRALAKELAPSHIRVNAIACGVIDTDMNRCLSEDELEILRQEIPADRLGTPQEVAALALQLVQSPGYLTGQIITMDGGWC
ncbi:MAG: SDR family oxidoreductase [Acetatifactor sp.]|nr:SDR family oxidoreductase [Acetatifactor sp.]